MLRRLAIFGLPIAAIAMLMLVITRPADAELSRRCALDGIRRKRNCSTAMAIQFTS